LNMFRIFILRSAITRQSNTASLKGYPDLKRARKASTSSAAGSPHKRHNRPIGLLIRVFMMPFVVSREKRKITLQITLECLSRTPLLSGRSSSIPVLE